jgi:hypothetical protein
VAEPPAGQGKNDQDNEEWPFKSPCAFQGKNRKGRATPRSAKITTSSLTAGASDIDSLESESVSSSPFLGKKEDAQSEDVAREAVAQVEEEGEGDDEKIPVDAWRKRESWKNSSHTDSTDESDKQDPPSERSSDRSTRNSASKDKEPAKPKRNISRRPDAAEEGTMQEPPSKQKSRNSTDPPGQQPGEVDDANNNTSENADIPRRSSRSSKSRSSRSSDGSGDSVIQDDNIQDDELASGSFHGLVADDDKMSVRSKDRQGRARGGTRRRASKSAPGDRTMDSSDHDDADDEFYEEVVVDDTVTRLKGEEDETTSDPESGDMGEQRKSWRERRDNKRSNSREQTSTDDNGASQERGTTDGNVTGGRRPTSSRRATAELSRSAHSTGNSAGRHSGGGPQRGSGLVLGTASFHEMHRPTTSSRRRRDRARDTDSQDPGSNHDDSYENYDSRSGRSQRTLDSIEDLEDFEHVDFQTPGMIDMDEETYELMQRANPEETGHLNRRVQRQRDRLTYDQNMPMMTRQALLTRQGSVQAMRQRVDASNLDMRRILLRNDSMNAATKDELSWSQHRTKMASMSNAPGSKRAPPRTKSSGLMGASSKEVPTFLRQQVRPDEAAAAAAAGGSDRPSDRDRRQQFRTGPRSNTNSFRQYMNKPNKVAQLGGRRPGSGGDSSIDRHTVRGTASTSASTSAAKDRRSTLQRAKSATGIRRPQRTDATGQSLTPGRADDAEEQMPDLKSDDDDINSDVDSAGSTDSDESPPKKRIPSTKRNSAPKKPVQAVSPEKPIKRADQAPKKLVESISPRKPIKRIQSASPRKPPARTKSTPVQARMLPPAKKPKPKRDLTKKNHRRKLHSLIYEQKMGVNMKDLFKEVKKGQTPRESLLMIASP